MLWYYLRLLLLLMISILTPAKTVQPEPEPVIIEEPTSPQPQSILNFTADDKDLLVKVAFLEAGNQGWEGMAAVMNVLINRSNLYNASIREIVYSPNQFTGILDLIPNCVPSEAAYTALWAVEQGWDISQGALYFCSPTHNSWHASHLTYLFTFNGHEFYK